jgi:tyrocidine synthetase-3
VEVLQADVTDENRMQEVRTKILERFGTIDGIIHAAGIAAGGVVQRKTVTSIQHTLAPKVTGALVLDRVFRQDSPDFVLYCSSLTGISGEFGQFDYAAANTFLDALAHAQQEQYDTFALSVDWCRWLDVGMAEQAGGSFGDGTRKYAITPVEGIEVFKRVLSSSFAQVVISTRDLNTALEEIEEPETMFPGSARRRPELKTVYTPAQSDTERTLAGLWQEFFGFQPVGVHDDFFEAGGDSLKAVALTGKIHKMLEVEIPLAEFFKRPTVRLQAEYVDLHLQQSVFTAIEPVEKREYYPLSPAQRRLFALYWFDRDTTAYNTPETVILRGEPDFERLSRAFNTLIECHESLRTSFHLIDGEPVQIIHDNIGPIGPIGPIRPIGPIVRPFDLSRAPLLRVEISRVGEGRYLLMLDMHHIIADGISMIILVNQLGRLYGGEDLTVSTIQYKDFALWQNRRLASGAIEPARQYWLHRFKGELPVLALPTDHPRGPVQRFEGAVQPFEIDEGCTGRLKEVAAAQNASLYMILLAAYHVLLFKYSGQTDIIVGSPTAGRRHPDTHDVVGMFVNTLAMRNFPEPGQTFADFLKAVRDSTLDAFENQEYPFDQLVELLQVKRDISRNPVFDTMFSLLNMEEEEIKGLEVEPYDFDKKISAFDITVQCREDGYKITGRIEYCTPLFKAETMTRLASHFIRVLEEIVKEPGIRLRDIHMLSEPEVNRLLYEFNDTEMAYPSEKTVHQLFGEQVERTPDSVALTGMDHLHCPVTITYEELNQRAEQLALELRQAGIAGGGIVGLMMGRTVEMITGIIGILKTGAAYLPLDPGFPGERIRYMLEDSGASLLVSGGLRGEVHKNRLDSHFAYVIYTSGSTGKPKGVCIPHRAVINFVYGVGERIDFSPCKVIVSVTTISFDIFVLEALLPLLRGMHVVLADEARQLTPRLLGDLIVKMQVNMLQATPSRMRAMINDNDCAEALRRLSEVMVGGEAFPRSLLNQLREKTDARIYNMYGPTETTVWSTIRELTAADAVTLGTPIANTQIRVISPYGVLQPIGVYGELYIGGDGLAAGYLNKPELTAQRFADGYATGDLVRWLPDGDLEFAGRIDQQVKIRGFRIEPGEIEAVLNRHPAVRESVAIVKEDHTSDKMLAAYYIPATGEEATESELSGHLKTMLPAYMVPQYIVPMETFPMTSNRKIDRNAFPGLETAAPSLSEYESPSGEVETVLARIWREVLGREKIGINDDFFRLGGHSLKGIHIISIIKKEFGVELTLPELFGKPTVKELSRLIPGRKRVDYTSIEAVEEREYYPLSSAQARIFALQQFNREGVGYNIPSAVTIKGDLEISRVEDAFNRLIERHESLRTSFHLIHDTPVQIVRGNIGPIGPIGPIRPIAEPFDLSQAPLLRVGVTEEAESTHVLYLDMHHIISDGVSIEILIHEFCQLYNGAELAPLTVQYKDFALWRNRFLKSGSLNRRKRFWLECFAGDIPVLSLPVDYPRPPVQSMEGDRVMFEAGEGLTVLAQNAGATLHMVLLAVYNVLLSAYSGQQDIIVGTPAAGRGHIDLQGIIGMFVNTLAMRNCPEPGLTFRRFLEAVKHNSLAAIENQDYPFDELVEHLELPKDISRNPLFDTLFALQNNDESQWTAEQWTVTPYPLETVTAKFDVSLNFHEHNGKLEGALDYCTKLFKKETMSRFAAHYLNILEQVTRDPDVLLGEIDLLSEAEKTRILYEFTGSTIDYPKEKTIHQLFEEQAVCTPDRIAVTGDNRSYRTYMTYKELNRRANGIASLLKEKGITPGSIVAVRLTRTVDMSLAILGILKAGGAYLPVDPDFPRERVDFMLKDSGASLLLEHDLLSSYPLNLLSSPPASPVNAASPAYILYTSGSTGKPKGVIVEHRSVNNLVWGLKENIYRHYLERQGVNVCLVSPFIFDASVKQVFASLLLGCTLHILDEDTRISGTGLLDYYRKHRIDISDGTPTHLRLLIEVSRPGTEIGVKHFLIGGEPLPRLLTERFFRHFSGRQPVISNVYGPTECTVDASVYTVTAETVNHIDIDTIPIGKPMPNYNIYILSVSSRYQPVGIPGEIYIAGDGTARGYLNRPELTEQRFAGMYKTGDLGCWLPDGNIRFLGRLDFQVKVRGFRIEPEEIEQVMLTHPQVNGAVTVARKDKDGYYDLAAYFTGPATDGHLREYLASRLPAYMAPSFLIKMDTFPLTPSGKVNRRGLPEPLHLTGKKDETGAPANPIEEKLLLLWRQVLEIEDIGIHDNFFQLGGHSLKAIIIASKIELEFQVRVPVPLLFKKPTIKELAAAIASEETYKVASIQPAEKQDFYELTSAQKRMYFLHRIKKDNTCYNMPAAFILEGAPDTGRFERAFSELIRRHESLRTSFHLVDGEPVQKVRGNIGPIGPIGPIRPIVKPFDLSQPPLIRVGLSEMEAGKYVLMIDVHHIISDGLSMKILVREFMAIYNDRALSPVSLQYKDFAQWHHRRRELGVVKEQEAYWLREFEGELSMLDIPTDFPRPPIQGFEGDRVAFGIPSEETAALNRLGQKHGATLFMVLLSVYSVFLSKLAGAEEVVIGVPAAGRGHSDLDGIIGLFVNTIALRTRPRLETGFEDFLDTIRRKSLEAFENQDCQFEVLVQKAAVKREAGKNPLLQVGFVYQDTGIPQLELPGLTITPYDVKNNTSKVDLEFYAEETGEGFRCAFAYSTQLFKEETVRLMSERFLTLIRGVVEHPHYKIKDLDYRTGAEKELGQVADVEFGF